MELMGTCAEKLKKRIQGPIPERILGKMTVAVSQGGKLHLVSVHDFEETVGQRTTLNLLALPEVE